MDLGRPRSGAGSRLLVTYLVASLVPVLALMLAIPAALRLEARTRGLAEARAQAALLAQASVEPVLGARPLQGPVPRSEAAALLRLSAQAVHDGHIVRLRIRDLQGKVAFADDGALNSEADDAVAGALRGEVEAELTRLNADVGDHAPVGSRVVEVYRPLEGGDDHHVIGVLEVYLPYAPIQADVDSGLQTLTAVSSGGLILLYLVLAFVSASATRRLRRQAAENEYLATVDQLTELPNRASFRQAVDNALVRDPSGVAVAMLDLEGFREINETLGHQHGDEVLQAVARRLSAVKAEGDQLARLGGDEFALLLTGLEPGLREIDAMGRLERARQALVAELTLGGIPLALEAGIGWAMADPEGALLDSSDLVRQADIALHQAKLIRRPLVRYSSQLDQFDPARLGLLAELRRGIDAGQLVLHYQPQISIADGSVHSAEALVRWTRPDGTLLMPVHFLDAAESTGLIEPLTDWVIADALRQITTWGDDLADIVVAVNVSARNLAQPGFAEGVLRALREAKVAPGRLTLEITETALLADPETARVTLGLLDAAGVAVSIDDFGHGHTALAYLADLPVHELKIDRGFVVSMAANPAYVAIVRSMVDLGHNLGLRVVAEGVSEPEALEQLADLGCDVAQGWLIAQAMPADQFAAWLAARRGAAPIPVTGGAGDDRRGQGLG